MYDDSPKPLSDILYGLAKLEVYHFLVLLMAVLAIVNAAPDVKPYEDRGFFVDLRLVLDYNRLNSIAISLVVMNAIVAGSAFSISIVDLVRKKSLPLVAELLWCALCLVIECVAMDICMKARFQIIQTITGGTTAAIIGADGKITLEDVAAIIMVSWDIMTMVSIVLIMLLSLHFIWHFIVSLRHLKTRPRVFLEPTPGSYPWYIRIEETLPTFQTVKLETLNKAPELQSPVPSGDDARSTPEDKAPELTLSLSLS